MASAIKVVKYAAMMLLKVATASPPKDKGALIILVGIAKPDSPESPKSPGSPRRPVPTRKTNGCSF
jgi:hypothetical protein